MNVCFIRPCVPSFAVRLAFRLKRKPAEPRTIPPSNDASPTRRSAENARSNGTLAPSAQDRRLRKTRRRPPLTSATLAAIALLATATVHAAPPVSVKLDNGATLLVVPEAGAKTVAIACAVRVGADDERKFPGITSLLARLLGVDSVGSTSATLLRNIDAFGAFGTDYDGQVLTAWTVSDVSPDQIDRAASTLLFHAIAQPRFDEVQVEAARLEQRRVLALQDDGPLTASLLRLRGRALGTETGLLGTSESLSGITAETVRLFHQRYIRPDRAVIAMVGKVDFDTAKRLVQSNLNAGGWNDGAHSPASPTAPPAAIPPDLRESVVGRPGPAAVTALGYLAPGLNNAEGASTYATLLTLDAVLGGGKASRLFGLRSSVGYEIRSVVTPGARVSLWSAYVLGDRSSAEVTAALSKELAALSSGERPITDDELVRAKALLRGQHLADRQAMGVRARQLAWAEAIGVGGAFETDFDKQIDAVTVQQVNALAKTIFTGNSARVRTPLAR